MKESEHDSKIFDHQEDDIEATDTEMTGVAHFAMFLLVGLLGMAGLAVYALG